MDLFLFISLESMPDLWLILFKTFLLFLRELWVILWWYQNAHISQPIVYLLGKKIFNFVENPHICRRESTQNKTLWPAKWGRYFGQVRWTSWISQIITHSQPSINKPNLIQYVFNEHLLWAKDSARLWGLENSSKDQ
jgi:hypothetical protein